MEGEEYYVAVGGGEEKEGGGETSRAGFVIPSTTPYVSVVTRSHAASGPPVASVHM